MSQTSDGTATEHTVDPPGTCPACHKYFDQRICGHIRNVHRTFKCTQEQAAALGIKACSCGKAYVNTSKLNTHLKSKNCDSPSQLSQRTDQDSSPPPPSTLSLEERHAALGNLPGVHAPLPSHIIPIFSETANRLATAYLANPTDESLFDILALVKVGLAPHLKKSHFRSLQTCLRRYPNVPLPSPLSRPANGSSASNVSRAQKSVEKGHISRAARQLAEEAGILEVNDEVIERLKRLHPAGPPDPFGSEAGPPCSLKLKYHELKAALKSIRPDKAPGISGWTPALFEIAFQEDTPFAEFFQQLTLQISRGSAPGRSLLCASSLTPLDKRPGVRPIAVGELFYRISMRSILKNAYHSGMLLDRQFGVMQPGGVEPIIRATEKAWLKELPMEYEDLFDLDLSNAFNEVGRSLIATAVKKYAPQFYQSVKWSYGSDANLYLSTAEGISTLLSTTGSRQGDPLGGFIFSLGYRAKLEALQEMLGPRGVVLAYEDNTTVLATGVALQELVDFFKNDPNFKLNATKTKHYDLKDPDLNVELLGSHIGSQPEAFLEAKVKALKDDLARLSLLPAQHALILLRSSYQHKLRHLLRSIEPTESILAIWKDLDQALRHSALLLRGQQTGEQDFDKDIIHLPVRLGGLGLLSYEACAPHARAASIQVSDHSIRAIFAPSPSQPPMEEYRSQRERCQPMLNDQAASLFSKLKPDQAKMFADNTSTLAAQWLSAIPYTPFSTLTAKEVAVALSLRTLTSGHLSLCLDCAAQNSLGHDECCRSHECYATFRHESIKKSIAYHLRTISGVVVELETTVRGVRGGDGRTDLRITGEASFQTNFSEYDVSIISMFSQQATGHLNRPTSAPDRTLSSVNAALQDVLQRKEKEKINKYGGKTQGAFHPLIFSSGGTLSTICQSVFNHWSKVLGRHAYQRLLFDLSICLIRARSRSFAL